VAKMEIVQTGCPVLHMPAREVPAELFGTAALARLIETMKETMRDAPGVGLAAPQIGVPLRIIVLEDQPSLMTRLTEAEIAERERTPFEFTAIINPVLRSRSKEMKTFKEGCLSVRGLVAEVERHLSVEVTGVGVNGEERTPWVARGWPARILQHEIDHLDGILYFQRAVPGALKPFPDVEESTIPDAETLDRWIKGLRFTQTPH